MIKVIFGAVYRKKHNDNPNDQHYYYYIPVAYKTTDGIVSYRMVDTYEVNRPSSKVGETEYENKINFLEQANFGKSSWGIYHSPYNYYYKNYYDISSLELDENEWEVVADLHNYKIVSPSEMVEYLKEDTLDHIPLWNEDCYSWGSGRTGSCFVKKEAKKDGWRIYNKSLNENSFGFESEWRLGKLEETCKDVLANMKIGYGKKKHIKKTLKKIKKYRKLAGEYGSFCKSLEKEKGK